MSGRIDGGLRRAQYSLRYVVFSAYYAAVRRNHRHGWYAPKKRVGSASFRSYELVNKHGDDALLRRLLRACEPGDVVYDVGANTGVYSLAVAANEPTARVVAFEPNPDVAAQLRANVARNGFGDRITVREEGVGDRTEIRRFHRSTYDELGSFDARNAGAWEASVRDEVDVHVVALDDIVEGIGAGDKDGDEDGDLPSPDHLKIDVEGYGLEVLRGARETLRSVRPTVYFEPHREGGEDRTDEVASLLRSLGYRIRARPGAWLCVPTADEVAETTD
ncbi:FkbM family methyltransferase [Haloprofundus halophilus]|uniref:FkbM family methyltransferase n=1 Tax=Haloprofundus halophilus TaxID=2283527 RepID=UPI000E45168E|nr:FkbM family methyltransferase [Haloprofundus halophilus]